MDIPLSILPVKPTVQHLKNAIRFLQEKYQIHIPVVRSDGKTGSPLKHDYMMAVTSISNFYRRTQNFETSEIPEIPQMTFSELFPRNYLSSEVPVIQEFPTLPWIPQNRIFFELLPGIPVPSLPLDVLLCIFSMDFHPTKFKLLNHEMREKCNTESFYQLVCRNCGYISLPSTFDSFRVFFLTTVDVSSVKNPVSLDVEGANLFLMNPGDTAIALLTINITSPTIAQLRHIVTNFYFSDVPIPDNCQAVVLLAGHQKFKLKTNSLQANMNWDAFNAHKCLSF